MSVLILLQRITGLENSLLGFTSRIQPIVMSGNFELDDFSAIDVVCFGIKKLFECNLLKNL